MVGFLELVIINGEGQQITIFGGQGMFNLDDMNYFACHSEPRSCSLRRRISMIVSETLR